MPKISRALNRILGTTGLLLALAFMAGPATAADSNAGTVTTQPPVPPEGRDLDWSRWNKYTADSRRTVDYAGWNSFLQRFAPSAEHDGAVDYLFIHKRGIGAIGGVVSSLQGVPVSQLDRDAQLAYWLNLHNAASVYTASLNYPYTGESTRSLLLGPPWRQPSLEVEGQTLSLDDISRRIVLEQWNNPLVLYGLYFNAAGGPVLAPQAYTGERVWQQLAGQAQAFIRKGKAAEFHGHKIHISIIYRWRNGFFADDAELITHLSQYAKPATQAKLQGVSDIEAGFFNWRLHSYNSGYYVESDRMGFGS